MAKCNICQKKIEMTFLNKLIGTQIKKKGKLYSICAECQKKLSYEQILEKIK